MSLRPWENKYVWRNAGAAIAKERKVYDDYHLEDYFRGKKNPPFPLVMMIEGSGYCQEACSFCPREIMLPVGGRDYNGLMDMGLFKKIVDESAVQGEILGFPVPCQMTFHYSGEPLMDRLLPDRIKYAKEVAKVPFIRFNTNGLLLREPMTKKLIESGVDKITVSLEATKEIHEATRLKGNYDATAQNIQDFMALKKRMNSDTPALWMQTLTSNLTTEQNIVDAMKKWEGKVDWHEITPVATIGNQVTDFGTTLKRYECDDVWVMMAIFWNGDTTVCCVDHNGKLKKGNLKEQTVLEVWNTPEYAKLRDAHRRGDYSEFPECNGCLNHYTPKEQVVQFAKKRAVAVRNELLQITQ